MTMKRFDLIMLVSFGLALLIAAHGLVFWGGIKLSGKMGGWLPWIAGGAVIAFALKHVMMAFGLTHAIRRIRGKGQTNSHPVVGDTHR